MVSIIRLFGMILHQDILFLGDDMETSPGGAYLTDAIKIVGNIFENGDAACLRNAERQIKYRASGSYFKHDVYA